MLTLKLINEETEKVIKGLEKKHFTGAKEAIDNVLAVDKKRRESQFEVDKLKAEANQAAKQIGMLVKQGLKEEVEAAKAKVAELKEQSKALEEKKAAAEAKKAAEAAETTEASAAEETTDEATKSEDSTSSEE